MKRDVLQFRGKIVLDEQQKSFEQEIGFNSTMDARIKLLNYIAINADKNNNQYSVSEIIKKLVKDGRNDLILIAAKFGMDILTDRIMIK